LVGIEGAVRAVAARNLAGDLGRQVGDIEGPDAARATFPLDEARRVGSTPAASGVTMPSPVTTTRLIFGSQSASGENPAWT
jgi:hypothetical protein